MSSPSSPPSLTAESRLTRLFNQLQPPPETVVLVLAVLIGGSAGLSVLLFRYLIETIHHMALEDLMGLIGRWGAWTLACVPALGGLLVGIIRWFVQEFSPNLMSLMGAVEAGKEIPFIRPIAKTLAAAISLGTGASLGPEGPSVEVGANIGILLGQALKVSRERQKLLLGAGAAAGLAAGFNAPIAGVFFALEVVLGTTFETTAVSVVLLAAVISALITQIGLGAQPAFDLPTYEVRSSLELPLYLGLGLLAYGVAIVYTQLLQWLPQVFQGKIPPMQFLGRIPLALRPLVGGLCVGLVALHLPQVLGIGYETVEAILRDVNLSLGLLLVLLLAKMVLTAVSLGSGLVGGIFAPALFLGASLGAAYGKVLPILLPMFANSIAAPAAYATVGMATVLAASVNAPLTAILLLFEMTRDYRIILPLMAAVGLSVWLVNSLSVQKRGELPALAPSAQTQKEEQEESPPNLSVAEAMQAEVLFLSEAMPVVEAGLQLIEKKAYCAFVTDNQQDLMGLITLGDINRVLTRWETDQETTAYQTQTVGSVCTRELLLAYGDEPLKDALDRMGARDLRQLPVVDRNNPQRVLGLLTRENIRLAYSLDQTRRKLLPYLEQAMLSLPLEPAVSDLVETSH
ncbi:MULTISPECIES: chloride channel protein [unclassified Thermosynechococcus]|uniref:chloride channel protein n=1 Tax=unclassified Thermosynechococcus TaxID=2622553 RepID=UPI0028733E0D|nr:MULTISPECIES: chloride channel protein [unclassified Thermosynechococcus]WNC22029.1 chloride channel protein [Thermosynechococcus sp. PP22]WNC32268.1 chloride channel protein [Thermosynechococcus sp. PKX95]WNC34797.1 chloride channel protein [Thermosynechococcus sp. PKX91]WNC37313.1 chloride channel protein [Thermosynechococcus sp. WL11]WNC39835.1 chloride channel protein [Thermosynechococcus sp. WL17]